MRCDYFWARLRNTWHCPPIRWCCPPTANYLPACTNQPHSAADILPIVFACMLDLHQTTFALGKALAHLHLLWFKKKWHRRLCSDGIYRFNTPKPP